MIPAGPWELKWFGDDRQWHTNHYDTFAPIFEIWSSGGWPNQGVAKRVPTGDTYNAKEMSWMQVCRNCGHVGHRGATSALNGCVLVVLLLLLIIPGIIYLVWGMTTPGKVFCRGCLAENSLIPISSPQARPLIVGAAATPPAPSSS